MRSTVTVRVPEDLKAKTTEYDINVSEVVRKALETEVRQRRKEALIDRGNELSQRFGDQIETERVVETIREDRGS
jgi:antitoxin CcdA